MKSLPQLWWLRAPAGRELVQLEPCVTTAVGSVPFRLFGCDLTLPVSRQIPVFNILLVTVFILLLPVIGLSLLLNLRIVSCF